MWWAPGRRVWRSRHGKQLLRLPPLVSPSCRPSSKLFLGGLSWETTEGTQTALRQPPSWRGPWHRGAPSAGPPYSEDRSPVAGLCSRSLKQAVAAPTAPCCRRRRRLESCPIVAPQWN